VWWVLVESEFEGGRDGAGVRMDPAVGSLRGDYRLRSLGRRMRLMQVEERR
jgi:hypothetical protein